MRTTYQATYFSHYPPKWYLPNSFERLISSFVDTQDDIVLRR